MRGDLKYKTTKNPKLGRIIKIIPRKQKRMKNENYRRGRASMKYVRKRIKQYVAALLVVTMVFTQFVTSYAQSGGMNGIQQYDTYHTYDIYDTATASDEENKIPVTPDEDTDEDEIALEDDRYDDATASEILPSVPKDPETASRSNAARMASETYRLRYKAVVNGSWQIMYEEEVCEGDDGIPPEVPEREGYTFAGWDGSYVNVSASRTVTATYVSGDVDMHVVTFVGGNGRLVVNPQYVRTGRGAIRPSEILYKQAGSTFLGWDREVYNVTEDMEIGARYAAGEITVYRLLFEGKYNGSNALLKCEWVPAGEDGTPPEIPEREGYTFTGWKGSYVNVQSAQNVEASYLSGEHTVHIVRFTDHNGRLVVNPQYVRTGRGATFPSEVLYKRDGYTFLGWDSEFYNVTEDMEVGARYLTGEVPVYRLRFQGKYNDLDTVLKCEWVPTGEDGTPPEVPEREGYTFTGWKSAYVNVQSARTVEASYLSGEHTVHIVRFIDHNGRLVVNPQYVRTGRGATFPSEVLYKRDGFTFLGWDREFYNVTEDMEVGARYLTGEVPVNRLRFQGKYNDLDTILKCEWILAGSDGTPPEVPEREGYTFSGWKDSYVNVQSARTVEASYLSGEHTMHVVRFMDYDGSLVTNPQYVRDGMGVTRPSATLYQRDGYTFRGWDREFYEVTGDLVVKPEYWSGEYSTYWLAYQAYHNGVLKEIKREWVPDGQNGMPPEVPGREGFTFAGWTPGDSYLNVKSSKTITGKYISGDVKMHVVYFYGKRTGSNDYTVIKVEYVRDGGSATPPAVPEYAGYTFRSWQGDYTNITLSKSIFAVYDSQKYTVNFWNGETLLKSQEVQYGSWATAPSAPAAPEGYYFNGWDKDYQKVAGNLNVYAVFEPIEGVVILITTEEFKQRIRALDLPEDVEESLIDLGIKIRAELDKHINVNTRMSHAIPMEEIYIALPFILNPTVLTAIGVVALGLAVWAINYGTIYLVWIGFLEAMEILGEYVGKPVASAVEQLVETQFVVITGGLGSNPTPEPDPEEEMAWIIAYEESLKIAVAVEGNTIIIDGTRYKCDTLAENIAKSMERENHIYYPAMIIRDAVCVAPQEISRAQALAIMSLNNDKVGVMAVSSKYARGLCSTLGGAEGPEGDAKGGYWYHYHGKVCRKAHCWFLGYD